MRRLPTNHCTEADNSIEASRFCQLFCRQGNFEGAGDPDKRDIFGAGAKAGEGVLGATDQATDDEVVPSAGHKGIPVTDRCQRTFQDLSRILITHKITVAGNNRK
jgi:hypothetical protein